jgi:hypothetical protein
MHDIDFECFISVVMAKRDVCRREKKKEDPGLHSLHRDEREKP